MVELQVEVETMQQTPKPAAQPPEAVPPLEVHSEAVKQVPCVLEEVASVHSSLGNCTTVKRDI